MVKLKTQAIAPTIIGSHEGRVAVCIRTQPFPVETHETLAQITASSIQSCSLEGLKSRACTLGASRLLSG
jgi:hypothetical protein